MPPVDTPPKPWATALHRSARPLIALATQLRSAEPANPATMGAALNAAVQGFERELTEAGCDARTVTAASYLMCVWLDEVIAPHAWAAPTWPASSLLQYFHGESDGRVRVFQLLDRLLQRPDADRPLLELFHACLSLGLQGHWQDSAEGARTLVEMRARLAELLQLNAAPLAQPLSTRWMPALAARPSGIGRRLVLAGLMLTALTGLAVYTTSQLSLARQADQVFVSLQGLEQSSQPAPRGGLAAADAPAQTATSATPGRMASALAADLQSGRLSVRDEAQRSLIVLAAAGLFQADTTKVSAASLPLLDRIGAALAGNGGRVLVTAYARPDAARPARLATAAQLADEWARHVAQALERRLRAASLSSEGRVFASAGSAGAGATSGAAGPSGVGNFVEITLFP